MSYRLKLIIALASIMMLAAGCLPTKVVSLKDPMYNNMTFKRILVIADLQRIEEMKGLEDEIVYEMYSGGTYAVENYKLLPPIREYTSEERSNALKKYNFDGYLLVTPQGFQTTKVYVPDVERRKVTTIRDSVSVSRETSRTVIPGGEMIVPTKFNTQIKFVDMKNGNVVWQSDTETEMNKDSKMNAVILSLSRELVKQLRLDGVIK